MRTFLAAALAAGVIFSGCQRGRGENEIRFSWWGNEARNNATIEAIRLYESLNPGVRIIPEFGAVDGYVTRMQAQIAAGNAPDIFTVSPEDLPTYVDLGACADLTGLIDLSSHNQEVARASAINGRLYGVNLSLNANVIIYNKTLAEELGIGSSEIQPGAVVLVGDRRIPARAGALPRAARHLARHIEERGACSVCYAGLIHALFRMEGESLEGKIHIGQGFRNMRGPGIGYGECAGGFDTAIGGCPPGGEALIALINQRLP